ncbi:MAG: hypothetical protein P4L66_14715 [Acetobacteraceae bacterium]|nr:hypothetical protein [Acetobacteraceae bacterium]
MNKRPIPLSPDVIHKIWSFWKEQDADEDAILRRVLSQMPNAEDVQTKTTTATQTEINDVKKEENEYKNCKADQAREEIEMAKWSNLGALGKLRWVDDIRGALMEIGGEADLAQIYRVVERIRKNGGRSVPKSLEATVRQSIESHCPTSENYRLVNGAYFEHTDRGRYKLIK